MNNQNVNVKEASSAWLTVGFIFAFLGGAIGVFFGLNYAFGNYDKDVKNKGWAMIVIGAIAGVIWKTVVLNSL